MLTESSTHSHVCVAHRLQRKRYDLLVSCSFIHVTLFIIDLGCTFLFVSPYFIILTLATTKNACTFLMRIH